MKKYLLSFLAAVLSLMLAAQGITARGGVPMQQYFDSLAPVSMPSALSQATWVYSAQVNSDGSLSDFHLDQADYSFFACSQDSMSLIKANLESCVLNFVSSQAAWSGPVPTERQQVTIALNRRLLRHPLSVGDTIPMSRESICRTAVPGFYYMVATLYYPTVSASDYYGVVDSIAPYVIRCYNKGQLQARMRYATLDAYDVLLDGEQLMYTPDGSCYEGLVYQGDNLIKTHWYYPNGHLAFACDVKAHNRDYQCTGVTLYTPEGTPMDATAAQKAKILLPSCKVPSGISGHLAAILTSEVVRTSFRLSASIGADSKVFDPMVTHEGSTTHASSLSKDKMNQYLTYACQYLSEQFDSDALTVSPMRLSGTPLASPISLDLDYQNGKLRVNSAKQKAALKELKSKYLH